jgi:hypothetical protein
MYFKSSFWNATIPFSVFHQSQRVYPGGSTDGTSMLTGVPKNSRRKIQRTRRAEKISLGIMNPEAAFRSAHSLRATASSLVFLLAVPWSGNCGTTVSGFWRQGSPSSAPMLSPGGRGSPFRKITTYTCVVPALVSVNAGRGWPAAPESPAIMPALTSG